MNGKMFPIVSGDDAAANSNVVCSATATTTQHNTVYDLSFRFTHAETHSKGGDAHFIYIK